MTSKQELLEQDLPWLRSQLKPYDEVWMDLQHVNSTGMSRRYKVIILTNNYGRKITNIAREVSNSLGWMYNAKHDTLVVSGAGMDMAAHVVHALGRVLFPQGFALKCIACGNAPAQLLDDCDEHFSPSLPPVRVFDGKDFITRWVYVPNDCPHSHGVHEFVGRNGDESGWDNDGGYALVVRYL